MSSDLLKEFGDLHENPWASDRPHKPNTLAEDDFGDFEKPALESAGSKAINLFDRPTNDISQHGQTGESYNEEQDFQDESWGESQRPQLDWEWEGSVTQKLDRIDRPFETSGTLLFDADEGVETSTLSAGPSLLSSKTAESITGIQVPVEDDDDFAAWEPLDKSPAETRVSTLIPEPHRPTAHQSSSADQLRSPDKGPPPTNIPPPAMLLSLSTNILEMLGKTLGKKSAHAETGSRWETLDDILPGLRTIGRIIAGRKSRWNRAAFLSQNMRIGQASSQGGMKLTKVDKNESRREDQEVAELLRTWKQHVGALRSRLASGHGAQLPDLAANMPVRMEKPGQGGLTAPKPCFLCGLKREERVPKVDFEVEDGFGLWWIEHWGHANCVEFWERHSIDLRQR